jgi:membrane fusion protein, multidrug efflux system
MGLDRMVKTLQLHWALMGAGVCLALGVAGCRASGAGPAASPVLAAEPSAAAAEAAAPAAVAAPVMKEEAKTFATTGPLVVEQQADVTAQRDGRVATVKVEIGDHVHAGELLAVLDDGGLEAVRAEKAARIDSLRAQVQAWEAEQKSNQADLTRADAMRAEKILDEEDWEHVKYKLSETSSEVTRYKAEQLAAEAELRAAEVELAFTRITAPFDGVVGRRSVHAAQSVKKGDVLFWVTAQAPLRILFTVPESEMARFAPGAKLELSTADYPLLQQTAHVFRVSPVVDPASGSLEVIGSLDKPSPLLKPGMSMQIKLSPR